MRARPKPESSLIGSLADEMGRRWSKGDRINTEELLDRHPDLWEKPEEAMELIYEEICLRPAA